MSDFARKTNASEDAARQPSLISGQRKKRAHPLGNPHESTDYWDQMEDVTATPPAQLGIGPGREGSRARKRPPEGLDGTSFPCAFLLR